MEGFSFVFLELEKFFIEAGRGELDIWVVLKVEREGCRRYWKVVGI